MLIVHHAYIVYTIIYIHRTPYTTQTLYPCVQSLPIISYPTTYHIVGNTGTAQRARLSPGRWEMEFGRTSSSKLQGMWNPGRQILDRKRSLLALFEVSFEGRDRATAWVAHIWGLDRKPTGLQPLTVCEGFCFWRLGIFGTQYRAESAIRIDDWCFIKIFFNYVSCSSHLAGATLQNLERDGIKSQTLMIPEAHLVLLRFLSMPGASFNIEAFWARRLGVQSWDQIDGLQRGSDVSLENRLCHISLWESPVATNKCTI